jgi:hypothetical protein
MMLIYIKVAMIQILIFSKNKIFNLKIFVFF